MKLCGKCLESKEESCFCKKKNTVDGLNFNCRSCCNAEYHERKARPKIVPIEKACVSCNLVKSIDKFSKKCDRIDGHSLRCKVCAGSDNAEYYRSSERARHERYLSVVERRQRNRKFIYNYLLTHECVKCGEKEPAVLEFDHLRDKSQNISKMTQAAFSIENIQAEINKCQILCANCHRKKTAKEQNWYSDLQSSSSNL